MSRLTSAALFLCVVSIAQAAEPARLTFEAADARLRHVYSLARESNDASQVERVLNLRDAVRRSFSRKDLAAAERLIRDAEEVVGLDRGGKTMLGLPVSQIDAALAEKLAGIEERLSSALKKQDVEAVSAATGEMAAALGNQASVPDVRRAGDRAKATPVQPVEVADLFLKAIQADARVYKFLVAGQPAPETLPRAYGFIVQGCVSIRPSVEKYHKDRLAILDDLVRGCCKMMLALQLEGGYFRFPDVRGKYMLLGESIDRLVEADPAALKAGWLIAPFLDGSTSIDTAECGIALLQAGKAYGNDAWKKAGTKAADWALAAPLARRFQFNACNVSLLCAAYRALGEKKYLEAARAKYKIGVEPGQAGTGRWIDPVAARTANHFVLLRSVQDLIELSPVGKDREKLVASAQKAVKAIIDEAESLGAPLTSNTVQELSRHLRLIPNAPASVRTLLEQAATASIEKFKSGGKVRSAVPLPELAAVAGVFVK